MTRTPEQILCCPRGCIMLANECCAVTRSNQTAGNGTQHFSVLMQMHLPDRLTLARALVPDGWLYEDGCKGVMCHRKAMEYRI